MLGKNLRYYRLRKGLSMKELASLSQVSQMSVSNYEADKRRPSMETIKALSNALGIRVVDLLKCGNPNLSFAHGEFRKTSSLPLGKQEMIRLFVEDYCTRFTQAAGFLPGNPLPDPLPSHTLIVDADDEENAKRLRAYLKLPETGPVGHLIERLENLGVIVFFLDQAIEHFSGMNGRAGDYPYIVLAKDMTTERIRSTIMHEVCHFAFKWPQDIPSSEAEKRATAIGAAFLVPRQDLLRELGDHREHITKDFEMVCREYGVAKSLLVMRAGKCQIISQRNVTEFFIRLSKKYGRKSEPSFMNDSDSEEPTLLKQLVFRAVAEDMISAQKGAELLLMPAHEVQEACRPV